jgi:RNA polymerase sigma-70 factor (ECF subfamily)
MFSAGQTASPADSPLPRWGARRRVASVGYLFRQHGATAAPMRAGLPSQHDEPTDASLVEAIASERSTAAFQVLFARYAPRLKAHYLRTARSEAAAEDLVQDVLISVWHHADSYRSEKASVSTWIFRIARNRFIDVVRRQRYVGLEPETLEHASEMSTPSIDDALADQQLGAKVVAALSELPEEQAEVVRGSYFLHESASQLAARLAIPIGTVKSRLRAALQHLKQRAFDGREP